MHGGRNYPINQLSSPDYSDGKRLADALASPAVDKIIHLANWRFAKRNQSVAHEHSALFRSASRLYGDQQQPGLLAQLFSQSVGKAGRLGAHPQIGVADAPTLQQFPYHAAQSGRRTVIETPRNNAELFSPTNLPWASTSGPSEKPGCITG